MKFARRSTDWVLPAIAAVCAALGWMFTKFGSEVTEGELAGIDGAVRDFVMSHQSSTATTFFSAVSMLGTKSVLLVLGVFAGWWLSNRSIALVLLVLFCGLVSAEFVDLLKEGFGVPRPPTAPSRSLSFPSGHVSGASSIVVLLSYVAWRRKVAVRWVVTASAVVVALMALSRVYLDRHWMSDTVGGTLIGVTLGLLACSIYEVVERPAPTKFSG